jgi:hypothetical protein
MIGHMKNDGRLDRNFLAGTVGDAINALLCGAGHNLRLILNQPEALLRACCRCSPFVTRPYQRRSQEAKRLIQGRLE